MNKSSYRMASLRRFIRVPHAARRRTRAITLVEMLISLAILGVISTAVMAMITGASNTYFYVNSTTNSVSQLENATRRITHNLRAASAVATPANTTASSTLTLSTQPDAANSDNPYTVTYSLSSGNLVETDPRYGTNTLVSGVQTFTVTRSSSTAPTSFTVSIILTGPPSLTRTFTVANRNF